jgi:hypothetical protein
MVTAEWDNSSLVKETTTGAKRGTNDAPLQLGSGGCGYDCRRQGGQDAYIEDERRGDPQDAAHMFHVNNQTTELNL